MTFEDLPAVVRLEETCFPNPWPLRAFKRELGDTATAYYLVATDNGRLGGYIGARIIEDEAHITTIGVDPDCRRHGIAQRLVLSLVDHGLANGVSRLTLEVRESNLGARKLYERFGFIDIAMRRKYYHRPMEDAVIMWIEDLREPEVVAAVDKIRASLGSQVPALPEPPAPDAEADQSRAPRPRGLKALLEGIRRR